MFHTCADEVVVPWNVEMENLVFKNVAARAGKSNTTAGREDKTSDDLAIEKYLPPADEPTLFDAFIHQQLLGAARTYN